MCLLLTSIATGQDPNCLAYESSRLLADIKGRILSVSCVHVHVMGQFILSIRDIIVALLVGSCCFGQQPRNHLGVCQAAGKAVSWYILGPQTFVQLRCNSPKGRGRRRTFRLEYTSITDEPCMFLDLGGLRSKNTFSFPRNLLRTCTSCRGHQQERPSRCCPATVDASIH